MTSILRCLRVEGELAIYIYPGSIEKDCGDCGVKIWVAPTSVELIHKEGAIPVCGECAEVRMAKEPGEMLITEATRLAVQGWLWRD